MGKPFGKDEVAAYKAFLYILPLAAFAVFAYNYYWISAADVTTGTITATDRTTFSGWRSGTTYTSIVEYTLDDGQGYTSRENWPSTFFKYDIGETVNVYYFEDDPENIRLGYNSSLTEISVGIALIWLFLLWYYRFKLVRAPEDAP